MKALVTGGGGFLGGAIEIGGRYLRAADNNLANLTGCNAQSVIPEIHRRISDADNRQ